jgi:hypothetical protein
MEVDERLRPVLGPELTRLLHPDKLVQAGRGLSAPTLLTLGLGPPRIVAVPSSGRPTSYVAQWDPLHYEKYSSLRGGARMQPITSGNLLVYQLRALSSIQRDERVIDDATPYLSIGGVVDGPKGKERRLIRYFPHPAVHITNVWADPGMADGRRNRNGRTAPLPGIYSSGSPAAHVRWLQRHEGAGGITDRLGELGEHDFVLRSWVDNGIRRALARAGSGSENLIGVRLEHDGRDRERIREALEFARELVLHEAEPDPNKVTPISHG